jgi:hypothetical protein
MCDPFTLIKTIANGGRVRFYLGEDGYVREFVAADVSRLLKTK